jgi:DNA-binding winged helix-turn-helix (wHTH) protein/TolB-like protein/Tfp pilus assembly protein PilF
MSSPSNPVYDFGPFRLNKVEGVLFCNGEVVPLTPKAFDTLTVLVEHSGHVVGKDELMSQVWPDSFVEETNLAQNISMIRKALSERAEGSQFIETVPKRGYRFVAKVSVPSGPVSRDPVSTGDQSVHSDMPALAALPVDQSAAASALTEVAPAATHESSSAPGTSDLLGLAAPPTPSSISEAAAIEPARSSQTEADATDTGTAPSRAPIISGSSQSIKPRSRVASTFLALAVLGLVLAGIYLLRIRRGPTVSARTATHTLAVLPFQDLKQDDGSTGFLGFSLADSIITRLDYVGSLIVRPSSYIGKYRNKEVDPKEAASELNVDTLLTGAYIKDGDDLRITTQLIDVNSNRILWRDTITLKYDKLLTVQDEVAQKIIAGLELNLSPGEAARLHRDVPRDPQAYEYYLKGVDLFQAGNFPTAVQMLQQSVKLDPNYAPSWAQLGASFTSRAAFGFGGRDDYAQAQAAYKTALDLNSDQVEARVYLANFYTDTNRVEQAVPLLKDAIKTSPNNALAHWELSYSYRFAGLLPESIQEAESARTLDPKVKINSSAINAYLYSGQYDQFLKKLPDDGDSSFVSFYRGYAHYYMKDSRAATEFNHAYDLEHTLFSQIGKALSYGISGQSQAGRDLLAETEKKVEETGVSDPEAMYKLAQAYLALGDQAEALRVLRHSVDGGFFCYPYMTKDPLFDSVRNDPEYMAIIDEARTRFERFRKAMAGT